MNNLISKKALTLSVLSLSIFLTGCNNQFLNCISSTSASNNSNKAIVRDGAKAIVRDGSKAIVRDGSKSSTSLASCLIKPTSLSSKAIVREG